MQERSDLRQKLFQGGKRRFHARTIEADLQQPPVLQMDTVIKKPAVLQVLFMRRDHFRTDGRQKFPLPLNGAPNYAEGGGNRLAFFVDGQRGRRDLDRSLIIRSAEFVSGPQLTLAAELERAPRGNRYKGNRFADWFRSF